ncbi:MAG: rhodanese-like domain-containing protein [Myxococcota bacterium]|nr:rhodanese-like domain-containing protein [Myxococcota bacterium]
MIRRTLKGLARRILRRPKAPEPARSKAVDPQVARTPKPPVVLEDEPEPVDLEIDAGDLQDWIDAEKEFLILDIREPYELRSGFAEGSLCIPMNHVPQRIDELRDRPTLVVVCAAGARSFGVAHYLREQGIEDAWSLSGGVGDCYRQGFKRVLPED